LLARFFFARAVRYLVANTIDPCYHLTEVTHITKQKNDADGMQENEVGTKSTLLSSEKKERNGQLRERERKKKKNNFFILLSLLLLFSFSILLFAWIQFLKSIRHTLK